MSPFRDLSELPDLPEGSVPRTVAEAAALFGPTGIPQSKIYTPPNHDAHTARATQSMDQRMAHLVDAMDQSLQLNVQAQQAAARTERFARRMAHASLWVSITSLLAAIGSLAVAIVALNITGQ